MERYKKVVVFWGGESEAWKMFLVVVSEGRGKRVNERKI